MAKGSAFSIPKKLSPQLAKLMGKPEATRGEIMKCLWAYIKKNSLQDPNDRRWILCDNVLKYLFNKDKIGMLDIAKDLKVHILN